MGASSDDSLNLFPKSSGPPGPISSSVEMYIRRRVAQEVSRALTPPEALPAWARPDEGRHGSPPPLRRAPALPCASERSGVMVPRAPRQLLLF